MRQFHFDFLLFIQFFGSIFFLNGFPNPFIGHARPSVLFEPNFHFSLMIFCSHAAFLHRFSVFFIYLIFFRNGFPNSLIVRSRSIFCLVNENSLNCRSGRVPLCFFLFRRHDFCYDHMTSQPLFVHSFMQFQLNCMCDVIFRS